jgi:hypothetical protein
VWGLVLRFGDVTFAIWRIHVLDAFAAGMDTEATIQSYEAPPLEDKEDKVKPSAIGKPPVLCLSEDAGSREHEYRGGSLYISVSYTRQ